jgi:hypothetical protein
LSKKFGLAAGPCDFLETPLAGNLPFGAIGLVEMEKQGQQRLYAVVPRLKNQLAANRNVLELGCCTFRFDKLPK